MTHASNHADWRAAIEATLARVRQTRELIVAESARIAVESRRIAADSRLLAADARAMRETSVELRLLVRGR
jgi:hypothetical protein